MSIRIFFIRRGGGTDQFFLIRLLKRIEQLML